VLFKTVSFINSSGKAKNSSGNSFGKAKLS